MTELEVDPRFPGFFVWLLPSSIPCFSFCNVSGIELCLGLMCYIQSLPVTEISEEKTWIGSFSHFFLEHVCYICYLSVKCNDSFYWIFSFPLSAEWFYHAQCKRYVLILPALFTLRGGRGFYIRNVTRLSPDMPCAVAALTEMSDTRVSPLLIKEFPRKQMQHRALRCSDLPLPPAQLCPLAALCCWSSTEGSKAFPEATGVGIVFPDLKPPIQVALKDTKIKAIIGCLSWQDVESCWKCSWGKHDTCSVVCVSWVL